jgi:pimeloyl-ACP methyl ester carboxylesterase
MAENDYSLPPVLMIHGMWSTGDTLDELKHAFESEGHAVFAPSLPNHVNLSMHTDESRAKLAGTGIRDYVDFIINVLEGFDQKPILVGHSMGGLIAQLVAAERDVEKLILISSASPAGINSWTWSVVRTFGHNLFKFPLWKTTTDITLKNIRYGIANSQPSDIQEDLATKVTLESGLASTEIGMWFLFRKPPTKVNYQNISCPVLIVSGLKDKITPPKLQQKIHSRFRSPASLRLLEEVCHWTIGGTYLPRVKAHIFSWLSEQRAREGFKHAEAEKYRSA